jgi:hypothetical protein
MDRYIQTVISTDPCPHCGKEPWRTLDPLQEITDRKTNEVLDRGCGDCLKERGW